MARVLSCIVFFLAVTYASALHQYTYEFGEDSGVVVYKYEGTIPLLQTVTNKDINVPPGVTVTYVRVIVNAVSPPKVDYHADSRRLIIKYEWTQITYSTYSVIVKGYL